MISKFLEDLREALENNNIENADEIVELYKKRCDLGLEASMSEEEILERFKSIDEIVEEYKDDIEEDNNENNDFYSLKVKSLDDNVNIRFEDRKEYDVNFIETSEEYKVYKKDNTIYVENVFTKSLTKKGHGEIIIRLPKKEEIGSIKVSTVSGDIKIESFNTENVSLKTVSGDIEAFDIGATTKIVIETVTGHITTSTLEADVVELSSVSGEILCEYLTCEHLKASTVTGKIDIKKAEYDTADASSVTGKVFANSTLLCQSMSKKVKNIFSKFTKK